MNALLLAMASMFFAAAAPASPGAHRAAPREFDDCAGAAWCPRMVVIPKGSFIMGSPPEEVGRFDDEGPQRRVAIRSIAVGKFPVTRGQWAAFVAATNRPTPKSPCAYAITDTPSWKDPGFAQAEDHPVVCVSWGDAQAYVRWLSQRTGHPYRLLSEAEWEYAARAGTSSAYPWGEAASHEFANYGEDECCGPKVLGRDRWLFTSPVGSFPANAFGLFDMHGNAFQWVEDCHAESYADHAADGSAYEPTDCKFRVARGGVYAERPAILRSAARNYAPPPDDAMTIDDYRSAGFGLRVASTPR